MPAREPSRPAWGMTRWSQLPKKEKAGLIGPMLIMVAIPMYQVVVGRVVLGHSLLELEERRSQNRQGHADTGWGIQAQGHGRYIGPSRALCQFEGHPHIRQIAKEHAQGCAREHFSVYNVGRILEAEDEDAGHERENRQDLDFDPKNPLTSPATNQRYGPLSFTEAPSASCS